MKIKTHRGREEQNLLDYDNQKHNLLYMNILTGRVSSMSWNHDEQAVILVCKEDSITNNAGFSRKNKCWTVEVRKRSYDKWAHKYDNIVVYLNEQEYGQKIAYDTLKKLGSV